MRTTVILPDELFRQVKQRAREESRTVTSFLEDAIRHELARRASSHAPVDVYLVPPSGSADDRPLVDLDDKDAVQDALDEDDLAVQQIGRDQARGA